MLHRFWISIVPLWIGAALNAEETKPVPAQPAAPPAASEIPSAPPPPASAVPAEAKSAPAQPAPSENHPMVILKTSLGEIKAELFSDKAPISTQNFLAYVDKKFYDGTIFHRVIPNFMIQGGGFDKDMKQKAADQPIKNEAANGLRNKRGTLAMARTPAVDSASSQFFINVTDNNFLDYRGPEPQNYGYAVFGQVISGMDVVDKIKAVATTAKGAHRDVPATPVIIESIRRAE